jgi:hypothetical protein
VREGTKKVVGEVWILVEKKVFLWPEFSEAELFLCLHLMGNETLNEPYGSGYWFTGK